MGEGGISLCVSNFASGREVLVLARLLRVQKDLPSADWDEREHPWVWIAVSGHCTWRGSPWASTILIYFHFASAVFTAGCLLKFSITEGFVK